MSMTTTGARQAAAAATEPPAGDAPSTAGPATWQARLGTRLLKRLLAGVRHGRIDIELPDGRQLSAEGPEPGPSAQLTLHRWGVLVKLALAGDVGLAEAYRDGHWSSDDLTTLLAFGARQQAQGAETLRGAWPARLLQRAVHRLNANSRRGSRQNIAFHYDLGNAFYAEWLDPELIYSSALCDATTPSLEAAQAAKLARIVELLQVDGLGPEASTLEIGCGWGALASLLARRQPGRVSGITLSTEQLAHARQRLAGEGLSDRVDLRLQDYRDTAGVHDRIVSIEMLEAVGEAYWPVYFDTLRRRLKPGGRAVVQVITIGDDHFDGYRRTPDFIQRFIFPGGMLPSPSALRAQAARAGLAIVDAQTFGDSYATTLVEWRRRFLAAWPALESLGFDEAFRRLWTYYLCYCEAGFRTGRVDVGLYVLRHRADAEA